MSGITKCCVPECDETVVDYANLCGRHKMPGAIMAVGESTMIVTIWVAEHQGEVGFILLNDYALGHLFGGRYGFETKLAQQGFRNLRNMESQQQFDTERAKVKCPANWSGPWLTEYPWSFNDRLNEFIPEHFSRIGVSRMSEAFVHGCPTGEVYFVTSPANGPGYQIYTEENLEAIGGVHALERTLEAESYWFVHLGQVAGILGSSGVSFKDSDLALLPEPPEHTWKIGRCNPAFGRPELESHVFRTGFQAVEQMLDLWKQENEGVVDAYALKEFKLTPHRLRALTSALITLRRTQEIVEISVMKYWDDTSWRGRPFPCDLVVAEFSLNLPLQFRWSASDKLLHVEVMHFSLCVEWGLRPAKAHENHSESNAE